MLFWSWPVVTAPERTTSARVDAVDLDAHRSTKAVGLPWPGDGQADRQTVRLEPGELAEDTAIVEHAALDRGGMNLIQAEPPAEQRAALGMLRS